MGREERARIAQFGPVPIIGQGKPQPPPDVLDVYGRALRPGDGINLNSPTPPMFKVEDLRPVVEPNAPPGLMEIIVSTKLRFFAPRGQRNAEFVRVMTYDELLPPAQPEAEAAPPATDPIDENRPGDPTEEQP